MQCPIDGTELRITDRQGIEIDYCPQCRGVWLDRGELDKIIDRSIPTYKADDRRDFDDDHYERGSQHYEKRKRKSFLDDLFDF